jgi:hypothetical protein
MIPQFAYDQSGKLIINHEGPVSKRSASRENRAYEAERRRNSREYQEIHEYTWDRETCRMSEQVYYVSPLDGSIKTIDEFHPDVQKVLRSR